MSLLLAVAEHGQHVVPCAQGMVNGAGRTRSMSAGQAISGCIISCRYISWLMAGTEAVYLICEALAAASSEAKARLAAALSSNER